MISPLTRVFRRAIRSAVQESESRRLFLKTGTLAAAAAALPPLLTRCTKPQEMVSDKDVKVAVVGGGIAGLNAARLLKKAGANVTLYEASHRTGGRILTAHDLLVKGAVTELGGELIDSNHTEMLDLAQEFGLGLVDLQSPEYASLNDTFFFGGKSVTTSDVANGIAPYLPSIAKDVASLPSNFRDLKLSPASALDVMSLEAYLTQLGITGWLRRFIEVAFVTENGTELAGQSALNFISLVATELRNGVFQPYGDSDERYKIDGGNSQITDRMAGELGDAIQTGMILENISKTGHRYQMTFRKNSAHVDVLADLVVMAIPFSILRTLDIQLELPKELTNMIHHLNYGQNSKIVVGFPTPFWREVNANGAVFSDGPIQLAWDNTALQGVDGGGLTFFHGGSMCRTIGKLDKDLAASNLVQGLSEIWPSMAINMKIGRVERMYWPAARFVKGSYSSYAPGQWTQMYGVAQQHVDGLYFAGEHTNEEWRGFMNGAAASGRLAAEKVQQALSMAK